MSEVIKISNKEFKICPIYPEYLVSKCGEVRRLNTLRVMKSNSRGDNNKYSSVRICIENKPKNVNLHVLVAETWVIGKTELKNQVNHKNGNRKNNHYLNLEWVSGSQNQRHALEHGLKGKGSELYNADLSDEEVHSICKHLQDGWLVKDISTKFSTSKDIIRKIRAGDNYFHIRQLYNLKHEYKTDFSESTVRWVCERIREGWSDKSISENSRNTALTIIDVKRIRHKIRYKIISDEYFD